MRIHEATYRDSPFNETRDISVHSGSLFWNEPKRQKTKTKNSTLKSGLLPVVGFRKIETTNVGEEQSRESVSPAVFECAPLSPVTLRPQPVLCKTAKTRSDPLHTTRLPSRSTRGNPLLRLDPCPHEHIPVFSFKPLSPLSSTLMLFWVSREDGVISFHGLSS